MISSLQALRYLLTLICIPVTVLGGRCAGRRNLALYKPTSQSSIHFYSFAGTSDRAVDGVTAGGYNHCFSCARTNVETNPWWMVDLEEEYLVQEVWLSSRTKFEQLGDFIIEVATSQATNGSLINAEVCAQRNGSQPLGETIPYPCVGGGIIGRYVRITTQANGELTLCEVQVYGQGIRLDYKPTTSQLGICKDTFSLFEVNSAPNDTYLISTTTSSPASCGFLCLNTDLCTSFAVHSVDQLSWSCRLYKCIIKNRGPVNGSSYFVQTFLLNIG